MRGMISDHTRPMKAKHKKNHGKLRHWVVLNDYWYWARKHIFVSARSRESALERAVSYIRKVYRDGAASTRSDEILTVHLRIAPYRRVRTEYLTIRREDIDGYDPNDCVLLRGFLFIF